METFESILEYVFKKLRTPEPVTHSVNGEVYAIKEDGTLGAPVRALLPQFTAPTLEVGTLDGLIGAYGADIDGVNGEEVAIHVQSPTSVALLSTASDAFGRRHVWVQATHKQDCPFVFGQYMDTEKFLIAFRASFYFNENAVKIQQLLSTLTNESAVAVSDDGISQVVTAKTGAVTRASVELPREIPLVPWRTFREAAPVESKFLLRLKGDPGKVPQAALFEIDAKWQLDTVKSVAAYLAKQLPDVPIIA